MWPDRVEIIEDLVATDYIVPQAKADGGRLQHRFELIGAATDQKTETHFLVYAHRGTEDISARMRKVEEEFRAYRWKLLRKAFR